MIATSPFTGILDNIHHLPLLLIGLAIFLGSFGARLFQKLRIPQVVGYIAFGLLIGRSGLKVIDADTIEMLKPFNFFALGVIGFLIGGELKLEVFKKFGKQFFTILLAEGLMAFIVVGLLTTIGAMMLGMPTTTAIALGLVLGAISSATAPAATVDVLWEYKSRGVLTTTVFAIVALDDGLALILYGLATSVASSITGLGGGSIWHTLGGTLWELGGAAVLGFGFGHLLNYTLRLSRDRDRALAFMVGGLMLLVGLAKAMDLDLILASMMLGMTLTNLAPRRSNNAFQIIESFAPPIYALFFVIVGSRLFLKDLDKTIAVLAVLYVFGRTGGKMLGAYLGAKVSRSAESVRKYLGLCLFSQAGVAVGLSILAADSFPEEIGSAIITIVTATTFLVQVIGPPSVKVAIKKAGEIGRNITEDELAETIDSGEMVSTDVPSFTEGSHVRDILRSISASDSPWYPVCDGDNNLLGVITINDLKNAFAGEGFTDWLVAYDLMHEPLDSVTADTPLSEAITRMREQDLEAIAVVQPASASDSDDDNKKYAGILELRSVNRKLSQELIRRQKEADEGTAAAKPAKA